MGLTTGPPSPRRPLPLLVKLTLVTETWTTFAGVRARVYREPLPNLVAELAGDARPWRRPVVQPRRLSRAVHRTLRIGRRRPTCIMAALVLFRLLRRQGHDAELVIGLLPGGRHVRAHAWVELGGWDLGPPPGRGDHVPMARYPT